MKKIILLILSVFIGIGSFASADYVFDSEERALAGRLAVIFERAIEDRGEDFRENVLDFLSLEIKYRGSEVYEHQRIQKILFAIKMDILRPKNYDYETFEILIYDVLAKDKNKVYARNVYRRQSGLSSIGIYSRGGGNHWETVEYSYPMDVESFELLELKQSSGFYVKDSNAVLFIKSEQFFSEYDQEYSITLVQHYLHTVEENTFKINTDESTFNQYDARDINNKYLNGKIVE